MSGYQIFLSANLFVVSFIVTSGYFLINIITNTLNFPRLCCSDTPLSSICMDALLDTTTLTLKTCGHEFHPECMAMMMKNSNDCAICRKPTSSSGSIGQQPSGTLSITYANPIAGRGCGRYENDGIITLNFIFPVEKNRRNINRIPVRNFLAVPRWPTSLEGGVSKPKPNRTLHNTLNSHLNN